MLHVLRRAAERAGDGGDRLALHQNVKGVADVALVEHDVRGRLEVLAALGRLRGDAEAERGGAAAERHAAAERGAAPEHPASGERGAAREHLAQGVGL